jgi:hypothetical protein
LCERLRTANAVFGANVVVVSGPPASAIVGQIPRLKALSVHCCSPWTTRAAALSQWASVRSDGISLSHAPAAGDPADIPQIIDQV